MPPSQLYRDYEDIRIVDFYKFNNHHYNHNSSTKPQHLKTYVSGGYWLTHNHIVVDLLRGLIGGVVKDGHVNKELSFTSLGYCRSEAVKTMYSSQMIQPLQHWG